MNLAAFKPAVRYAAILWAVVLMTSCSRSSDGDGSRRSGGERAVDRQSAPLRALEIASTGGCAVDVDCASGMFCFQRQCAFECEDDDECAEGAQCSPRGSCVSSTSEQSPTPTDFEPNARVVGTPNGVFEIVDQDVVSLRLELSGAVSSDGILYALQRSDEPDSGRKLLRARETDGGIEIPISAGMAHQRHGAGRQQVKVQVITAVGAFRVVLVPSVSVAGSYAGEVKLERFGQTGLPIELELVTVPTDATLDEAEAAWVVFGVTHEGLFSPIEAFDGAPEWVAAAIEYDDFTERWVATTEYEYRLGEQSVLRTEAGQVVRTMRFELEPLSGGRLIGAFSDRWEGLYDARSAQGVIDLVDVVLEGELELIRVGPPLDSERVPAPLVLSRPLPSLLPPPPLSLCADVQLGDEISEDEREYSCGDIDDAADFERANADEQAACALSSASVALGGKTTGAQIAAFLDDDVDNPGGKSFAEFMEDCAEGRDGTCVPSAEVLCARQLLARAVYGRDSDDDVTRNLVAVYEDVTREAFLGRQLAAFNADADTRLEWLKTTDYPAIVTSAVQDLVTRLLDEWQSDVLDTHMEVLGGYFDPSGLAVMSRATSGEASDARRRLLAQIVQGWRGALDALLVATERWDELYQDADRRAERAAYVRARIKDLYLMAGVLSNLSRDAGAGYQASAFGAGFSELMRSLAKLSLSFDELVFARDAEVVVSNSLDPESTNQTLLAEYRMEAEAGVEAAAAAVVDVLEQAREEALSETQLRNRMGNELNELRDELVQLCGLPVGCNAKDFRADSECQVAVGAGKCGFTLARETGEVLAFDVGQQSVSEAGRALLAVADASEGLGVAAEEVRAHQAQLSLELETLEALADNVYYWNEQRAQGVHDLQRLFEEQGVWEGRQLADLRATLDQKAATREAQIDRMTEELDAWNDIRVDGANSDFATEFATTQLRVGAASLRDAVSDAEDQAQAAAEALPKAVGASNDTTSGARAAILFAKAHVTAIARVAALGLDATAAGLETDLARDRALREAELARLQEEAAQSDLMTEQDLQALEEGLALRTAEAQSEIDALAQAQRLAEAQRQAQLAFSRDLSELNRRRTAFMRMLQEQAGLSLRASRAKLGVDQRVAEYLSIVQRAELMNARLYDLEAQRNDVNQLVGSPGAVFARANRLTQAENRLQRAKGHLMDWLVALEYFAVRPFVDQRLQILLARNPYQLEEILEEMARLERSCGGVINEDHAVLSLREQLLGVTLPVTDTVSGEELSPRERFLAMLTEGAVPIDKRVRYTTDSTIGDLFEHQGRVLAATFDIGLDDFANLASTCNAKVTSVEVQLVGDLLEAESSTKRPTVTLLYDGTATLRSCQVGISELVEQIGPSRTAFGEVTRLRVPGRAISPVATINAWDSDEEARGNASLAGLPIASQYTVLIDTQIGENDALRWENLEDILLDVHYVYSDVFPEGRCN